MIYYVDHNTKHRVMDPFKKDAHYYIMTLYRKRKYFYNKVIERVIRIDENSYGIMKEIHQSIFGTEYFEFNNDEEALMWFKLNY